MRHKANPAEHFVIALRADGSDSAFSLLLIAGTSTRWLYAMMDH